MVSTKSLLLTTLARPTPTPDTTTTSTCHTITPEQLTAIDPTTASCSGTGDFASECADATRAAPALTAAFQKYSIHDPATQAALIAIMLYESGSFKYNHNHFPAPGRPGQGTRNMQMAPYNEKYATELFGAQAVANAKATGTQAAEEDRVLALVQGDAESFGSAAWLLSGCEQGVKDGLATGSMDGWDKYLTQCVGTTHTADRDVAWAKAKEVLGA